MKFAYGLSDFSKLILGNYYYQDRTQSLIDIEEAGYQLVFLRPRRFGKSLLISLLEHYYDVNRADQFNALFGHLAIGKNPTPLHNQYYVMKWDFSLIKAHGDVHDIEAALHEHINGCIKKFAQNYQSFLRCPIEICAGNAISSFNSLTTAI